jgi:signal transduction histidine kinase/CheY-like chemotaxis protein
MVAQNWLRLAMAVSIVVLASFFGLLGWNTERVLLREADEETLGEAKELTEDVSALLHSSDLIAQLVDQALAPLSWDEITHSAAIHRELVRLEQEIPGSSITLIRPDGGIANDSRILIDTRPDSRQFAQARRAERNYVSPEYVSRVSGQKQFSYVYRRLTQDGQFNGAVVVSIPEAVIGSVFGLHRAELEIIIDDDGHMVAAIPSRTQASLDPTTARALVGTTGYFNLPGDGTVRASFLALPNFHLLVGSMIDTTTLWRRWFREMMIPTVVAVVSATVIIGVLQIALRAVHHEAAARRELRLAERAMYQSQHMEALGQLTAGVAHDFNNIMAVIVGNLDLLRAKCDERMLKQVNSISVAVNRGTRLVKHLLSFTRRQMIWPELLDVNAVLVELTTLIKTSVGGLVKLEMNLCDDALSCQFDSNEFELAVINICNNARQSMPDGGKFVISTKLVLIDAHNKLDLLPGTYVHIALTDSGEGMSAHVLEHAFEPFFTTRSLHEGTGIGLSQVYGFCKQARGMVHLQSTLGKGTMVNLYLPITTEAKLPSGGGMSNTVLLVEDNTELLEVVEAIFRDVGWTVHVAENGTTGLLMLKEHGANISLLLTDVVMPDMSGVELATRAKDAYPQIKVLLMTGYSNMQTGVLPLLRKPFRRNELLDAVTSVMNDQGVRRWY